MFRYVQKCSEHISHCRLRNTVSVVWRSLNMWAAISQCWTTLTTLSTVEWHVYFLAICAVQRFTNSAAALPVGQELDASPFSAELRGDQTPPGPPWSLTSEKGWPEFQPEPTDEINMTKMKIRHLRGGLSRARLGYFGMVPGSCLRMPLIVNSRLSKAWVVASHPLHLWLRAMGLIRHLFSIVFFMFHLNSYTTQILFVPGHIVQWGWPPLAYHHFTIIAKGSSSSFCSFSVSSQNNRHDFVFIDLCIASFSRVGAVCLGCAGIADVQGQVTGTQVFGTGRLEGKHQAWPWLCAASRCRCWTSWSVSEVQWGGRHGPQLWPVHHNRLVVGPWWTTGKDHSLPWFLLD